MIYFDNAATSYPKPEVVYKAVDIAMKKYSFNAGRGSYEAANKVHLMINETRKKIASLVDADWNDVVFTSSATESLNNIIYGLNLKKGDSVYVSPFEHNAIIRTLYAIGIEPILLPFDKETWKFDEQKALSQMIINRPKAVIISHISNVTGFELPYNKIFKLSKKFDAINVLDSAQGFGIYSIDKNDIDFIVFAGHKSLQAIFGIAGYIRCSKAKLSKYKVGGTGSDSLNFKMPDSFPSGYEAGSLNSIGIYSINVAIDFLNSAKFDIIEYNLTKYFLKKICDLENIIVYLPKDYCSKGIISFNVVGYTSDEIGDILANDYKICVRTGYHCAPYIHEFIDSKKYLGTVRVSFNGFNKYEEIDSLIDALKEL